MKQSLRDLMKVLILFLAGMLISYSSHAQTCTGGLIQQQTGIARMIWLQDQSNSNQGWITDSTHWDFGDGSSDSGKTVLHQFADTLTYKVRKSTRFSQPGNPSNFCIVLDSAWVDASFTPYSCPVHMGLKVKWLTGLTYGVYSYYYGCPYNLRELVVDTGLVSTINSGPVPVQGIYTTHQNFFTYTLPAVDNYQVIHHVSTPPAGGSNYGATYSWICSIWKDSIPQTPINCHASFFMVPDTNDINNWILYDYSSGGGLTYFWDFGDGTTSTQVSPTHTYAATGKYQVCLTVSNGGCSDTKCDTAYADSAQIGQGMRTIQVVNMHVGVKNFSVDDESLSVYPNPGNGVFTFSSADEIEEITIYNSLGEVVHAEKPANKKIRVSLEKAGIYSAVVRSRKGASTRKIQVTK